MLAFPFMLLMMLFLFAVAIVVAVIMGTIRARGRVTAPSCGGCGYAVEGLEILRCPECGADLRSVGIVTPDMGRGLRPRGAALLLALAWTLVLPLPASIATVLAQLAIPQKFDNTITLTLGPGPGSTAPGATIDFVGSGTTQGTFDSALARLTFADGAICVPLVVDLAADTCNVSDGGTMTEEPERPLSTAAVLDWMAVNGLDINTSVAQAQAGDIVNNTRTAPTARRVTSGPGFQAVNMSSTTVQLGAKWFIPVAVSVWIVIWLGGLLLVLRRYRRRRRGA